MGEGQVKSLLRALGLGAIMLCVPVAEAAFAPYQEYNKLVKSAEMVAPLKADLFGDNVSLYNGAAEFTVFDIDLAGNNSLPVKLGRTYRAEIHNEAESLSGFGVWDIEVPHMHAVFGSGGWNVSGNGATNRCSNIFYPKDDTPFYTHEIWSGTKVHIPGRGDQSVLWLGDTGNQSPNDGTTYYWGTRDQLRFRCTSMLNYGGEGFIAVDSEGTQYFFNYMIQRNGGLLTKASSAWGSANLARSRYYIVATRVQDRHGNYVDYEYSGDQLSRIVSSDGRIISLTYSDGVIVKTQANGREWRYEYAPGSASSRFWRPLTRVTRPDLSEWKYDGFGPVVMAPSIQDGSGSDRRCHCPMPLRRL